jgi:hypothetical protein
MMINIYLCNNPTLLSWPGLYAIMINIYLCNNPTLLSWPGLYAMMINILHQVHLAMSVIQTYTLVVISTDYTGSCKSTYDTLTTMMARS